MGRRKCRRILRKITLPLQLANGAIEDSPDSYDWKDSIKNPYGRSFAKLYTAIQGREVETYREVGKLAGDEIFKTNLYPIAFNSTDSKLWHKHGLDEITGFESKHLFNTWCFFNRFPSFVKLRKANRPKLIICTGKDYLRDFLMFFGGINSSEKVKSASITPKSEANRYDRTYYWLRLDSDTLLVVIPLFSGSYGLNSNYLLQEIGCRIAGLLAEHEIHLSQDDLL